MEMNTRKIKHHDIVTVLKRGSASLQTRMVFIKAIQRFVASIGTDPEHVSESDLRCYLSELCKSEGLSFASIKIHYRAIKFFYRKIFEIDFPDIELCDLSQERRMRHHKWAYSKNMPISSGSSHGIVAFPADKT